MAPVAQAADDVTAQRLTQRLFDAIRANDMAAVQASLSAGAHPDAADRWGVKPIDLAVDKGYYRIAQVIAAARQTHRTPTPAAAPAAVEAAKEPAAAKGTVRHGAMVPKTAAAIDAPVKAAAVTAPATMAWPAGVPNPFDPSMPPPRSQLLVSDPAEGTAVQ
ncbi:MAG: hypothetical protein MUE49_05340 [Rhodospirillales bacterium]|nr:hypothetical protein [Rhodospirillales bacterium]